MKNSIQMDYCPTCRKKVEYSLQNSHIHKIINNVEYPFIITIAKCKECGEEIHVPGLIDRNIQEIEEQYKKILTKS